MELQPRIEHLKEKKLIGKHLKMSLVENKTVELWRNFMPRRKEITNKLTSDFISMQIYEETMNLNDMSQKFEKWAVTEVANFDHVPDGMETFTLQSGLYAVFDYKGLSTDSQIFIYIYGTWLPNSAYLLDDRPHFEVLGDKYKNGDPNSEEEIWIPIKPKS
ncbi:MAG: GyrI-like domain-containing protein [Bacteroidota bacterium]